MATMAQNDVLGKVSLALVVPALLLAWLCRLPGYASFLALVGLLMAAKSVASMIRLKTPLVPYAIGGLSLHGLFLLIAIILWAVPGREGQQTSAPFERPVQPERRVQPLSPRTLKELRQDLKSADAAIRLGAARALGEFGHNAAVAVPDLVEALADTSIEVRAAAGECLGKIGPKARVAFAALVEASGQDNEQVWAAAQLALKRLGAIEPGDLPLLREALKSDHARLRSSAARSLAVLGPKAEPAISDLQLLLKDADDSVRCSSAFALFKTGAEPALFVPALAALLEAESDSLRTEAAWMLSQLGSKAKAGGAVEALNRVLLKEDELEQVKFYAAVSLGACGPAAAVAVKALIESLQSKHPKLREAATDALGKLAMNSREVVPALTKALRPADPLRGRAAYALGQFGTRARKARAALLALLDDEDPRVRLHAAGALWRVDPAEVAPRILPVFAQCMRDKDAAVQQAAAHWLAEVLHALARGEMPASADLVPALAEVLEHKEAPLRLEAIGILHKIGPKAKPAPEKLAELLGDADARIRVSAAQALWQINGRAAKIVPVLCQALKDKNVVVRQAAVLVLAQVGPQARQAVPALIPVLKQDESKQVRRLAALALAQIGVRDDSVKEALTEQSTHTDPDIRQAAAAALKQLKLQ